ncbi:transmembrane emp24 domain-containing protein bai-like protein [Dinothrombium tinctorium]|uniref:Transmembrane emp24 domain-containing protein bai-like protein n=1 Tax=Dinothrombium tinctorium TaxID=1965070 RepID=A0A443R8A4_9ACAR|nr:transmembrane emp24 domain-containing protein bai-like protein [Dinothrombium tinctorium]RWS13391.1 transmembrane emp24 domain-containing protein bai-like protein [Dinothrombium tinctorium]
MALEKTRAAVCDCLRTFAVVLFTLLIINEFIVQINGLNFYLESNSKRCLKEGLHKDVIVTGDYSITSHASGIRTDLQVTDSKGHVAFQRENVDKGKFAITADEEDYYEICFISYSGHHQKVPPKEVYLDLKHGVEAKNYEQLAAVSKLKPLEMELTKLEDLSASIVQDFEYMKKREEEMRDTNESTNVRVFYLSLFSMCCLLSLATWQVMYLRKFFKSKKLIE